jgi:hypothetical protein
MSSSGVVSSARVWIFRVLTLAAAGLMLVSWILPWWACDIYEVAPNAVIIHPWGLEEHLGDMASMIARAQMPAFFAPFMWTYLGVCMLALLLSLFAKERVISLGKFKLSLPQVLVGGVGISYIVVVVVAVIFAAIRTKDFWNLKLIGYTYVSLGPPAESGVMANLQLGYWLAGGVGILCLALALLRNKIIGKSTI